MANTLQEGPNVVHPEKPSALGSRNSVQRHGRDEYFESQLLIDEEVDKILNHIESKLPPEALSKLNVSGNIKELLHGYFNQSYHNMFNRYLTTVEDELSKKFRKLIEKEEVKGLNKFSSREIGDILENIAGSELFNTAEVEKSIINIYGHAQGNILRGVADLEHETNSNLRQKTDAGALLRGQNAYALVKCSFANNPLKPSTVQNVRIAINILESELISPVYHYQIATEKIIKDLVGKRILELVDEEVSNMTEVLIGEGRPEMSSNEALFEKFKYLDEYLTEEKGDEAGKYSFVGKNIYECIKGIGPEIDVNDFDPLRLRENIKRVVDEENIRNRGYNTILNMITNILDSSKMGYQHIENFKNKRRANLREYNIKNPIDLPDENYELNVEYFDDNQLKQMRITYDQQVAEFQSEVEKLEMVINQVYDSEFKKNQGNIDYTDLKKQYLASNKEEEEEEAIWDEKTFIVPEKTSVEQEHNTFYVDYEDLVIRLQHLEKKLNRIFGVSYSDLRLVAEDRIEFLKNQILEYKRQINPYHIQPGVFLEIRFTTIRRKNTTMKSMSNVLNELLHGISSGFADQAFAYFHRRRSTDMTTIQDTEAVSTPTSNQSDNLEGVAVI